MFRPEMYCISLNYLSIIKKEKRKEKERISEQQNINLVYNIPVFRGWLSMV